MQDCEREGITSWPMGFHCCMTLLRLLEVLRVGSAKLLLAEGPCSLSSRTKPGSSTLYHTHHIPEPPCHEGEGGWGGGSAVWCCTCMLDGCRHLTFLDYLLSVPCVFKTQGPARSTLGACNVCITYGKRCSMPDLYLCLCLSLLKC